VGRALELARARADLGAFWSLSAERALTRADEIDRSERAGLAGVPVAIRSDADAGLSGVPVAIKDNFDLAGLPTTGGLQGEHPPATRDAEAVRRLESAGAVAIGKTAMDTLAWSTHGQAEGFPPCRNPSWPELSPGGSSAGAAVAVAAGIVPIALGSDTAGSVRIPAAYCDVVGVKLAPDPELLEGCLPLARSFDCAGVLGESVAACRSGCEALLRRALSEPPALNHPVGVLTDLLDECDPAVAHVCRAALDALAQSGAEVEPVTLGWRAPELGLLLAVEFAAAWAQRAAAEPERFPRDLLSAIERARGADPARVRSVRDELRQARIELERRLGRFSALLSPTVPTVVPTLEAENVATSTRFTRIFSALGWPSASVPCGQDDDGRPVGMHVASTRGLPQVLAVAAMLERGLEKTREKRTPRPRTAS
jgi:Asp-tRNA(Asn)/Glu-tRNA(Gln) amidotransferase A subunit family amidase